MKKITTILTALILMFTLTFTTGCKKDGGVDPNKNKTTTEVVVGNDWKFTNSSPIKRVSSIDTIVSDKIYNYTYNLVLNRNTQTLTGTKTLIRKDVFFTPDGWVKTSPITLSIKD